MLLEKMKNWFRRHMEEQMAKIDLSNISHTYNPLDPKPTFGTFWVWKNHNVKHCFWTSETIQR